MFRYQPWNRTATGSLVENMLCFQARTYIILLLPFSRQSVYVAVPLSHTKAERRPIDSKMRTYSWLGMDPSHELVRSRSDKARAAESVLRIPELLDQILLCLPLRRLMRLQCVCRDWQWRLTNLRHFQLRTWMRASDQSGASYSSQTPEQWALTARLYNPLMHRTLRVLAPDMRGERHIALATPGYKHDILFRAKPFSWPGDKYCIERHGGRTITTLATADSVFLTPDSKALDGDFTIHESWRVMQIAEPPLKDIFISDCGHGYSSSGFQRLRNKDGITLGQLAEAASSICDLTTTCLFCARRDQVLTLQLFVPASYEDHESIVWKPLLRLRPQLKVATVRYSTPSLLRVLGRKQVLIEQTIGTSPNSQPSDKVAICGGTFGVVELLQRMSGLLGVMLVLTSGRFGPSWMMHRTYHRRR